MIINIIHKLFQEETNLALKLSNQLFLPFHNLLSNPAQTYTITWRVYMPVQRTYGFFHYSNKISDFFKFAILTLVLNLYTDRNSKTN